MRQAEGSFSTPDLALTMLGPMWESVRKEFLDRTAFMTGEAGSDVAIACLRDLRDRCEAHAHATAAKIRDAPPEKAAPSGHGRAKGALAGAPSVRKIPSRAQSRSVGRASLWGWAG
jgi:hypothetical protein